MEPPATTRSTSPSAADRGGRPDRDALMGSPLVRARRVRGARAAGLAWAGGRAADTIRGSSRAERAASGGRARQRAGPARSTGGAGGRGGPAAAARGRALRARRGAPARDLADAAPPDGRPALPAVAPLARAGRRRLRLPAVGRVRSRDRGEAAPGARTSRPASASGRETRAGTRHGAAEGRSAANRSVSSGPEGSGNARMNASSRKKSGSS